MARRRKRKGSQKQQSKKKGLGEAIFFGLALILGSAPYFLKDFYGVQFRFAGTYIWLAAYIFGFLGYLFYLVQFLLPLSWYSSWYEGLRLSFPFTFPVLSQFSSIFLMRHQAPAATGRSKGELSTGFLTHKAGMIPSYQAFAVNSGSTYSRAAGPGFVRLSPAETATQVVDLRRHMRRIVVEAMSSDGIPVEVTITVVFHVKHDSQSHEDDLPYPYDHESIFSINNLESIKSDQRIIAWPERIERTAYNLLVDELSRYSLDQLFQGGQNVVPSLSRVRARLKRRLFKEFDKYGVFISQVFLSKIELPEDVVDQRINLWQANWQSSLEDEEAPEPMELESLVEEVSIKAHAAVIQNILDDFEAVRDQGGAELADAILTSVSEAMKTVASNDEALSALPPGTSSRLRRVFDPGRLLEDQDD